MTYGENTYISMYGRDILCRMSETTPQSPGALGTAFEQNSRLEITTDTTNLCC